MICAEWTTTKQWLDDPSLFLALLSVVLAVIPLVSTKVRSSKVILAEEHSTLLKRPQISGRVEIKVDGRPVKQLTVTQFIFRNTGSHRIDKGDVEQTTDISCAHLTYAEVSPRGACTIEKDLFRVRPEPIDPGKCFVFQILHDADMNHLPTVIRLGSVRRIGKIETPNLVSKVRTRFRTPLTYALLLSSFVLMTLTPVLNEDTSQSKILRVGLTLVIFSETAFLTYSISRRGFWITARNFHSPQAH